MFDDETINDRMSLPDRNTLVKDLQVLSYITNI
jgi:hypothetical protein